MLEWEGTLERFTGDGMMIFFNDPVPVPQGYATIGAIGFEGRWDYGAIGTVTNLAARLCSEAKPGQVLASRRVVATVEELIEAKPVGEFQLKGLSRPVPAFNVVGLKDAI